MKKYNIAIVGATGLVGRTMLVVLEERCFPIANLRLLASGRSAGKSMMFRNKELQIEELTERSFEGIDIALFSAGSYVSEKFVPLAVQSGCIVIDNGSFWRMNEEVPLVVPEVNSDALLKHRGLIANPNCSTIQMVVALAAISDKEDLKNIIVSTYQAISGAGQKGLDKYYSEIQGIENNDKYKIFNSIMFHSTFNENGDTIEEEKMLNETHKILSLPNLPMNITCVRIPVETSHCENVLVELKHPADIELIKERVKNSPGIIYIDDANNEYPHPLMSSGRDEVFIGRLRKDRNNPNIIGLWVVADNVRKGAATNAVQIAEELIEKKLLYCESRLF